MAFLKHGALRLLSAGENHASPFGPLRKNGCFFSGQILSASAHIGAFTGKYDYAVIQFSKRSIWKVFEPYIFKMTLMNFGQPNFWSTENSHQLFIWVWERVGEKESEREIKKREYVGGSYIYVMYRAFLWTSKNEDSGVCVCVCMCVCVCVWDKKPHLLITQSILIPIYANNVCQLKKVNLIWHMCQVQCQCISSLASFDSNVDINKAEVSEVSTSCH